MSNQVQAQREYAGLRTKCPESLGSLIGSNDVPIPKETGNVENMLSSCLNWASDLEQAVTNLMDALGPVLVADQPRDVSKLAYEPKLSSNMSTVALRLSSVSSQIQEQVRRIQVIKDRIDL